MTVAHLTDQDQDALAERLIDVPWAVYLQGLDRIIYCTCLCLQQPCTDPFNAGSADKFARAIEAADPAAAQAAMEAHFDTAIGDLLAAS